MDEEEARDKAGRAAVEWTKYSTADTYIRGKLQQGFIAGYMSAWRTE